MTAQAQRKNSDGQQVSKGMSTKSDRFGHLVRAYAPMLQRYAFWLCRDKATAEDLVQETLLRAWRNFGSLRDEGAVKSWLITIVRREHARLYARQRPEIVDFPLEAVADPNDDREWKAKRQALREAIWQLPDHYRDPIAMQVIIGMTLDEIAAAMNIPQNTAATRCARARQKLHALLGEDDAAPATARGG